MATMINSDLRRWVVWAVCATFFSVFVIVFSGLVVEYFFEPALTVNGGHLFGVILVIVFIIFMIILRILWSNKKNLVMNFLIVDKEKYIKSNVAFFVWCLLIFSATLSLSSLAKHLLGFDANWFLYHALLAIVVAISSFRFLVLGSNRNCGVPD